MDRLTTCPLHFEVELCHLARMILGPSWKFQAADVFDFFFYFVIIQGQRSISRSNVMFYQINLWTSVIPLFHVIFTGKFISGVILMIQGHLEGQEVNFKVKWMKMSFLTNTIRNKCNKSFWCDFDYGIYLWYHYGNSRSSSRSKGQFQGQSCEKNIFNKYK